MRDEGGGVRRERFSYLFLYPSDLFAKTTAIIFVLVFVAIFSALVSIWLQVLCIL